MTPTYLLMLDMIGMGAEFACIYFTDFVAKMVFG